MLHMAGQTTVPIGLKFFVDTHGLLGGGGVIGKKIEFSIYFFPIFFYFSTGNAGPYS